MKLSLVSGGCGFVGRNMVKRLYNTTEDLIVVIDDLSIGRHPSQWLDARKTSTMRSAEVYDEGRVLFIQDDFRNVLNELLNNPEYFQSVFGLKCNKINDVFHFAAIVGGRATIDGDPMKVALDLAIDAEMFYWASTYKPDRILYPSSSAAYPVDLQSKNSAIALKESDISFQHIGQPDMTYGWSKLTGEYLAQIASGHYELSVTCIRPFSGYGEDQDLSYPIPAIAQRVARKEDPITVWGTGKQGRDFVHIDDVLDCILLAMDHIKDGSAINIGMGRLTSFLEIIEVLTKIAGYNPRIQPLPDKPVGVHSRYCDMSFVQKTLGWKPTISLEEGMRRMYHAALEREKSEG